VVTHPVTRAIMKANANSATLNNDFSISRPTDRLKKPTRTQGVLAPASGGSAGKMSIEIERKRKVAGTLVSKNRGAPADPLV
jgi:hypothetical protein